MSNEIESVEANFSGVALSKLEMLKDQGFEVCGVVMRQVRPTGVSVTTLSYEARVAWLDPVSVLGAQGVVETARACRVGMDKPKCQVVDTEVVDAEVVDAKGAQTVVEVVDEKEARAEKRRLMRERKKLLADGKLKPVRKCSVVAKKGGAL